MKRLLIMFSLTIVFLQGCDSTTDDQWCDRGYGDGFAAGYNTTCKIRSTMIEGAWNEVEYKRCYNRGYSDGSYQCRSERK